MAYDLWQMEWPIWVAHVGVPNTGFTQCILPKNAEFIAEFHRNQLLPKDQKWTRRGDLALEQAEGVQARRSPGC